MYRKMNTYCQRLFGLLALLMIIGCTPPTNDMTVFDERPIRNMIPTKSIQSQVQENTHAPTDTVPVENSLHFTQKSLVPAVDSVQKPRTPVEINPATDPTTQPTIFIPDISNQQLLRKPQSHSIPTPTKNPQPESYPTPASTPWPKCDQYAIPMTIAGRTLSERVTVWLGDTLLSETSNFILNYILNVPVCDSENNSLSGQRFHVKTEDNLVISGIIANGAKHRIDLMREAVLPTLSPTPSATIQTTSIILSTPDIYEISDAIPDYDRGTWSHWSDVDGDCQNTRHEVLISESLEDVSFSNNDTCSVATGRWIDRYTGSEVTEASNLDVDHMIPLQNAHISGGWQWTASKRKSFANYLEYENHLIAVTASANRRKGSRSPDEWKPDLASYWCQYSLDWVNIKLDWNLSVTESEWISLQEMLATCSTPITYSGSTNTQTQTQTPTPTPAPINPTATAAALGTIQISSVSCNGQPEIIYLLNTGSQAVGLTGWRLEDQGPKYTMNFPNGFTVSAGATVEVHSAASGEDTNNILYWTGRYVLNNNNDTAYLFNASGTIVSQESC